MYLICRLQKAKVVLQYRIHHLKSLITSTLTSAPAGELSSLHVSIATCYKRLAVDSESGGICGHISSALKHCKAALELDPENREGLWLSKLLERQQDVNLRKEVALKRLSEGTAIKGTELHMPKPVQVCTQLRSPVVMIVITDAQTSARVHSLAVTAGCMVKVSNTFSLAICFLLNG